MESISEFMDYYRKFYTFSGALSEYEPVATTSPPHNNSGSESIEAAVSLDGALFLVLVLLYASY